MVYEQCVVKKKILVIQRKSINERSLRKYIDYMYFFLLFSFVRLLRFLTTVFLEHFIGVGCFRIFSKSPELCTESSWYNICSAIRVVFLTKSRQPKQSKR